MINWLSNHYPDNENMALDDISNHVDQWSALGGLRPKAGLLPDYFDSSKMNNKTDSKSYIITSS